MDLLDQSSTAGSSASGDDPKGMDYLTQADCKPSDSCRSSSESTTLSNVSSVDLSNELQTLDLDSSNPSRPRSSSFTHGTVRSAAVVKYHMPQVQNFKFQRVLIDTNLKKPPDNWLRFCPPFIAQHNSSRPSSCVTTTSSSSSDSSGRRSHSQYSGKFGSYFWSYPFSKSSSWSMFSSFR